MEHQRAYGADALFFFPLLDNGAAEDFEATPVTIAAGDIKLFTDAQISTNPTVRVLGFDSGSVEPSNGDTLDENGAGTATCTFMFAVVVAGTWGGGDASGFMFVKSVSGDAWANNDQIDNTTTSTSDIATVQNDGTAHTTDLLAGTAGLFAHVGEGIYAIAATAAETSCRQGLFTIRDQTATEEWVDSALAFATFGHEDALDPQGCILTDAVGSATGQTVSNIRLSGAPATAPKKGYYFEITAGTGIGNAGYVKTYTAGANYEITPYVNLDTALDATSTVKFYRDAPRVPAHIVASEDIDFPATQIATVNAQADLALADFLVTSIDTLTIEQIFALMAAMVGAKASGMATTTGTLRNVADDTDRVVATVDASGNRTAVTLDFSDL